jgi:hypothetical protein
MTIFCMNRLRFISFCDPLEDTRWASIQTCATIDTGRSIQRYRKQMRCVIHGLWGHSCQQRLRRWDSGICFSWHDLTAVDVLNQWENVQNGAHLLAG